MLKIRMIYLYQLILGGMPLEIVLGERRRESFHVRKIDEAKIREAEAALGVTLPDTYKSSF